MQPIKDVEVVCDCCDLYYHLVFKWMVGFGNQRGKWKPCLVHFYPGKENIKDAEVMLLTQHWIACNQKIITKKKKQIPLIHGWQLEDN